MKPHTLPVKRRPVRKSVIKRLSAVTQRRKQRAATAVADDIGDDHSSKIARALTIIFLIHVVAIGLIIFHKRYLESNNVEAPKKMAEKVLPANDRPSVKRESLLSSGDKIYMVKRGDNYTRIAEREHVSESDLRAANQNIDLVPGLILELPPQRIVAMEPPEVTAIRNSTPSDRDRGLVETEPYDLNAPAPRAILVHPKTNHAVVQAATASGETYVVQNGDSIWRISNRFKVDQNALMKLNGISDAKKLRVGMTLKIPR